MDQIQDFWIELSVRSLSYEYQTYMYHSIYSGKDMGAYVTTDLSSKGTFWVQVEGRGQQTAMFQRLQDVAEGMHVFTAIFRPGNLVAARFSEDNLWYRVQVESIQGEMVSDEGVK